MEATPQLAQLELLHDFGGSGPVVHLAHANGFPPGAYRHLADTLTRQRRLIALPARPLWPGSRPDSAPTWRPLADDLIQGLDGLGLKSIVGVGHSLGAVLTLWAAIQRPDLFRIVVLIDPVVLPPSWLWMLRLVRWLGFRERQPLVQGALQRRRAWPTLKACFDHFRGKPLFANWSDQALWAYVESATRQGAGGQIEMAYPPEWEAHIFATVPTAIWGDVQQLSTPALVVRGEHSRTFRPQALARMAHLLPEARFVTIPSVGHLLPMESPERTGAVICEFLEARS